MLKEICTCLFLLLLLQMLTAVNFDNQFLPCSAKVNNIRSNWVLAAEFYTLNLLHTQSMP